MIGLLRVKNEARWIERVLLSLQPVCSRLLVMDDHSSDNTVELAVRCGAEVLASPFADKDEARDKDWLLGHAGADGWALMVDGDEELHPADCETLQAASQVPGIMAYALRILYLWDDCEHVRMDGVYGRFYRPSMFRLQSGLTFRRTGAGGNFHCSSVPAQYLNRVQRIDVRLLHYGYLHREDRLRKFGWYNLQDPGNQAEDGYRHMVIGDLFPAESRFRYGGPLEVRPL